MQALLLTIIFSLGICSTAIAQQALESLNSLPEIAAQNEAAEGAAAEVLQPDPQLEAEATDTPADGVEMAAEKAADTRPAVGYVPEDALDGSSHFDLVAQGPSPADLAYAQAREAEQAGDLNDALEFVMQGLSSSPEDPRNRLAQGRLLFKLGDYQSSVTSLQSLIEDTHVDWRAWYWLGSAQLMLEQLPLAAKALDEALNYNGEVAAVWINRALVEQQRGDHRTALQLLGIAKELAPNNPQALLNIAYSSGALGYTKESDNAYRQFLTRAYRGEVSNMTRFAVIQHLGHQPVAQGSTNDDHLTAVLEPVNP